jgi:hypothetical protein
MNRSQHPVLINWMMAEEDAIFPPNENSEKTDHKWVLF